MCASASRGSSFLSSSSVLWHIVSFGHYGTYRPNVRMPVMDGVVATGQVHRQLPSCRILMLTTFDDEEYIIDALRAGASGYLLKDLPAPDLASAVQAVYKGIYQLDPAVAD